MSKKNPSATDYVIQGFQAGVAATLAALDRVITKADAEFALEIIGYDPEDIIAAAEPSDVEDLCALLGMKSEDVEAAHG